MKRIHFIRAILNLRVVYYHLLPVNWQFQKIFFKKEKKLSIPGLPTIKIFFLFIPSLTKFVIPNFVGAKCKSLTDDINFLFSSSGKGFLLSKDLNPASLCAMVTPAKFAAKAHPAAVVVSPCTITNFGLFFFNNM